MFVKFSTRSNNFETIRKIVYINLNFANFFSVEIAIFQNFYKKP